MQLKALYLVGNKKAEAEQLTWRIELIQRYFVPLSKRPGLCVGHAWSVQFHLNINHFIVNGVIVALVDSLWLLLLLRLEEVAADFQNSFPWPATT
jgi:hypothetical protein